MLLEVALQGEGLAGAELFARERINFAEVLAGGDASSGVPQVALGEVAAQPASVQGSSARALAAPTSLTDCFGCTSA